MKRLLTISLFALLLQTKTQAQTQFPFYGFELSNYEVGDTLEYLKSISFEIQSLRTSCDGHEIYIIIEKETFNGDSVRYTIQRGVNKICNNSLGQWTNPFGTDTFKTTIINDTIYGSANNLFSLELYKFDTSGIGMPLDSAYVKYDTLGSLKRLCLKYTYTASSNINQLYITYKAIENIGLINLDFFRADISYSSGFTLIYAHLFHYGIYGKYKRIYLDVNDIEVSKTRISIQYDNGNIFLFFSSPPTPLQGRGELLSIYDLLGRKIKTMPVTIGSNRIDMDNSPKGMYLYKVESEGKIIGQGKMINN